MSALLACCLAAAACGEPAATPPPAGRPEVRESRAACVEATGNAVIDWVPFVRLDGRTYTLLNFATFDEDEARVAQSHVAERLGEVRCKLADRITDPDYRTRDGDAGFLEPGTALHALAGFDPGFRIVALTPDGARVHEAEPPPFLDAAREFYGDIEGRVAGIRVNSEEDGVTVLGRIDAPEEVSALVGALLDAPLRLAPRPDDGGVRYFLDFELEGAPRLSLVLFARDGVLGRGIRVPASFVDAIERAVAAGNQGEPATPG